MYKKLSATIFVIVLGFMLSSATVHAATSGKWIDAATIELGGQTFYDTNPYDQGEDKRRAVNKNGDCQGSVTYSQDFKNITAISNPSCLDFGGRDIYSSGGIPGLTAALDVTLTPVSNASIIGYSSGNSVFIMSNGGSTGTPPKLTEFVREDSDPANTFYLLENGQPNKDYFIVTNGGGNITDAKTNLSSGIGCGGCRQLTTLKVSSSAPPANFERTDTGSENLDADNSCASKGGALGWILCPVTTAVGEGLGLIDETIVDLLIIDSDFYTNGGVEGATGVMRGLAFSLLIPIMLVMVISTALGFDFVSAYTVKTALPRMIIATIFIALSFPIMVFVIDLVQNVGHGVQNIILNSFSNGTITAKTTLNEVMQQSAATTGANVAGLGIGGAILGTTVAGASFPGAILAVLGILASAAIMMLGVFLLLLFRQTVLVFLVIIAPLAILPWIFPGRDKLFSLWNKTFWLMVWFYPTVMAVIAVGKAMAIILLQP